MPTYRSGSAVRMLGIIRSALISPTARTIEVTWRSWNAEKLLSSIARSAAADRYPAPKRIPDLLGQLLAIDAIVKGRKG